MKAMLSYGGYEGVVTYVDMEANLITGEVLGLRDVIHFQGHTPEELKRAFEESVEDYLSWCAEDGIEPEKPFSGILSLRLGPALHRKIALSAQKSNKSLNEYIKERLEKEDDSAPSLIPVVKAKRNQRKSPA